jgi:aminopeptidase N
LYVDFPRELKTGQVKEVTVAYHGQPVTQGRFGCFSFDKDKEGKPWITTACEGEGPSVWWPNKDQWKDEPQDGMEIDVSVPNGLMDVSNGRFIASKDLGDGYTEWQWRVHYPINNYDVALNIGEYQHWSGVHVNKDSGEQTTLDYYALPEDLAKAKVQFEQVPGMLDAYEHLGEYPFDKDGYKLIEVPYSGMEHQTAVSYGNHFENGYYGRDWTGVGISPKFDFIIIHESGHEWFGNAVSAADRSDMWIHEGWTTYLEELYVEYRWGKADAIKYLNGLQLKIKNRQPIIPERGTNSEPTEDQYFKGALMLNTLRSMIDDDAKWFVDIHDFYQQFKYQNIMTEDVVEWWNKRTGMDLTPFFNEYLRHAALPVLELKFDRENGTVAYRWNSEEAGFAMPIKIGDRAHLTLVTPVTTEWTSMPWTADPDTLDVPQICITSARRRLRRSNEVLAGCRFCGAADNWVRISPGRSGGAYSGECADTGCSHLRVEGPGVQHGDGVYAGSGAGVEHADELSRRDGSRRNPRGRDLAWHDHDGDGGAAHV